jgi:hypothetical protein
VVLIDGTRQDIYMGAYVLTDWPVIQALTALPIAASRAALIPPLGKESD